jgi:uncharacterized protein with FMN-binding domain
MATATASRPVLDTTQAARLDRLAARNRRSNVAVRGEPLLPPVAPQLTVAPQPSVGDVDQALKARLDKLAAARAGSGRSDVPPTARTNAPTRKRRHPAKHSRAAALTLSVLASGGLAFLFAQPRPNVSASQTIPAGIVTSPAAVAAPTPTVTAVAAAPSTLPTTAATPAPVAGSSATPATPATPATLPAVEATTAPAEAIAAAPVSVNGDSFRNKWGDVQVQATFAADGTIIDIVALQMPDRDTKSVQINDRAVPRLNSEALSAQSANIDTVSGATYTSVGYRQSLQSAIDIAIANGLTTVAATT